VGISNWLWHLVLALSEAWMAVRLRVVVEGPDRWPEGPLLVCAKHGSSFDVPLLAGLAWRKRRTRPHFQMGAFVGYPVLGRIVPLLRRLGGFPVLRPKEVRRLAGAGEGGRDAALRRMRDINSEAERTRAAILDSGGILVVFPEGTRDASMLRPLRATVEFDSAHAALSRGRPVRILPVLIRYGPRTVVRRSVAVRVLPPFEPDPAGPTATCGRLAAAFAEAWGTSDASPPRVSR
jgi:1-acyl-sn-glycerol-3-phosphate acyltransferase